MITRPEIMIAERSAGVLLHPTSLPEGHGIGDLGPAAHAFLAWLQQAGFTRWQVLPLGPTGYGNSPYQALSSFAGNTMLISLDFLVGQGLLEPEEARPAADFPLGAVDYPRTIGFKRPLLAKAALRLLEGSAPELVPALRAFREQNADWLDDFSLYSALKSQHRGEPWYAWQTPLALRASHALAQAREDLRSAIDMEAALQFLFTRQSMRLRQAAHAHGVRIIGDLPIFVAHDSADVWARPDLFELDENSHPLKVAGVPPDAFSKTGQLWGNPVYRWASHAAEGYAWWIARMRSVLDHVDIVRIDHFRGFEAGWQVPAGEMTAAAGEWVPAPGGQLLRALEAALGRLPAIAEDLGLITPQVRALRQAFGLPGMAVLQFAFDEDEDHPYLPQNVEPNTVIYTGTHDNDTTLGWYASAAPEIQERCRLAIHSNGDDIVGDLIMAAWASPASTAIVPAQDLLRLDDRARMNIPGRPVGNWSWRLAPGQLDKHLAGQIRPLLRRHNRIA